MKIYEIKTRKIFQTKNYDIFKHLEANRAVTAQRVNKIKQSVLKIGWVGNPITVNEKMQVIDGQARLKVCEDFKIPVDYSVVEGIGIDECRAMNVQQSNWTMIDFVESYAESGELSYQYFNSLIKQFKGFGITVLYNALTGLNAVNHLAVKSGEFKCSVKEYDEAVKKMTYLSRFKGIVKKIKGRADFIYMALAFAYEQDCIDNERLYDKMSECYSLFETPANIEQSLDEISKIYNNRLRGEKVYLSTDYKKYMDKKYGWYSGKYGRARHYTGG